MSDCQTVSVAPARLQEQPGGCQGISFQGRSGNSQDSIGVGRQGSSEFGEHTGGFAPSSASKPLNTPLDDNPSLGGTLCATSPFYRLIFPLNPFLCPRGSIFRTTNDSGVLVTSYSLGSYVYSHVIRLSTARHDRWLSSPLIGPWKTA